ncbi:MAG TPA: molybdopterin containing oxidoreductase [Flavobacteriales bacterium]|nr:molybdopterin containing oxidoreductase [Flavobacteriales bacterium]
MSRQKQSRKSFLKTVGLVSFGSVLAKDVVYAGNINPELAKWMQEGEDLTSLGKSSKLTILNNRPWNVETPAHLLDDKITPADKLFIRNNGIPPSSVDPSTWTLTIDGESVEKSVTLSIDELKSKFEHHTYQLTIECGGNGRAEFDPPAKGNQWTTGAVGCPSWTGVRLKDVLNYAGVKKDAVYIGYYGKDVHLSGDANKVVISRGVPISKALEDESLIAWSMNGQDIPAINGHPLRLVIGGWPASTSGKWLSRISIRNKIHDGPKMEGHSYRIACDPVEPGAHVEEKDMCIIESMPVKSLITYPKSGAMLKPGQKLELRGHAWAGDLKVSEMHVSIDFGESWIKCNLEPPVNRLAWQHWSAGITLPKKGYYEVWARARDENGGQQPMIVPGWNPKGYLNNATHRIAVKVG